MAATTSTSVEVVVPILTQYKLHVASLLSKASNLSSEQTLQLVEERFEEDYDLSVAMMKIKKFKVEGDPAQLAVEWQAKVRAPFGSTDLPALEWPLYYILGYIF